MANRMLTNGEQEMPDDEKKPVAPAGKGPAWGYRAAENEQGWEGKIFNSREEAGADGWVDSPHEFALAKQKQQEQEAKEASKRAAARLLKK